ncbi:tyrosine-type recombinase/integrase [Spirosoma sp. HMF3257]|uniref:Tyr recombinase domain-containing protein n=1 Tax=Spirosoma telluris TaxID=2183553 RepID=A0A327NFL5_9BACT|nr:tyrosine-type recombinase/integrase [Spirosoma telluris]RAI72854.1 hypothetical protein HMF3257_38740 [Spirosoma telluris]
METLQLEFHTLEEQAAILASIKNEEHRVQALLMMDGGGRVSEIRTVKWEACNFQKKVVTLQTSKQRGEDKKRTIPMSDRLYAAFDDLIKERQKENMPIKGYVFPSPKDPKKPIGRSAINMSLKRLGEKVPQAGKLKPHKLRHTAATNLAANGAKMVEIRDFLGHTDSRVTDIYTHANPEQLRSLINASAPKPTFWEKWKARLFPPKRNIINLLTPDTEFIFGRDRELKQIQGLVSRGISVLITGSIGVGKTHLLQSLNFEQRTLLIDDCSDFKSSLKAAILHICGDKETAASMLFATSDLKSVETKLSTTSLANLVQTLKDLTQQREYLLKIGNIDGITPRIVKVLEELKEHFTIIMTARSVKMEAASFAWNFTRVELKPLGRPDSLKMIYRLIGDLPVRDLDAVMTKLYETADGNPRKIRELCDRLRREPFINMDAATEVADAYLGRQVEEFDFSVILLVILVALCCYGIMAKRRVRRICSLLER